MDFMSVELWTSLFTIILIDLMLAGDNAIVIGLAARNLPKEQQRAAVIWGTLGAVVIRITATIIVASLMNVPWLHLIGGLLLLWIAYKLLVQNDEATHQVQAGRTLGAAIRTIIIADAAMGIDNILAVAGASRSHIGLIVIGLLISIPIVVWGSTIFIRLIDRFSWFLYVGSAVLVYTAAHMITGEEKLASFFNNALLEWSFIIVMIVLVVAAGALTQYWQKYKHEQAKSR